MKIECSVIGVESHGESIEVTLQGAPPTAASWRPLGRQVIKVPATDASARAFYIGRRVVIEVSTK